jgi:HEAT repeat protein
MPSEFEQALSEIANDAVPLSRPLLAQLSGPSRADADRFREFCASLDASRKRDLMARMVEYAEESFELDYVDLFRACLSDSDPQVRKRAIEGLWEDERADLVQKFLGLLTSDPAIEVRAAAAGSLGRFLFRCECEELDERHGRRIREQLEAVIEDTHEDIDVRRRAIESIAFINDDKVRAIIDRAYDHDDQRMRESAVFAMGRSADSFWNVTVMAELYSPLPAMRYEAIRAAGELGLRRAVNQLIRLSDDPDTEVQIMAIWALGQIGGKRAKAALERQVDSENDAVVEAAEEALSELELLSGSWDMMTHQFSDADMVEEDALDDDDDDLDDLDQEDEDGWADDYLDI